MRKLTNADTAIKQLYFYRSINNKGLILNISQSKATIRNSHSFPTYLKQIENPQVRELRSTFFLWSQDV